MVSKKKKKMACGSKKNFIGRMEAKANVNFADGNGVVLKENRMRIRYLDSRENNINACRFSATNFYYENDQDRLFDFGVARKRYKIAAYIEKIENCRDIIGQQD